MKRIFKLIVRSAVACLATTLLSPSRGDEPTPSAVPLEAVDAETRAMWLIDGQVVDASDGMPIESFTVTPGTLSIEPDGKTTVRFRDNLHREMTAGRLRWPRTSGFAVMRFRVSADGYRPLVTPRIHRGGPHVRIRVQLQAEDDGQ